MLSKNKLKFIKSLQLKKRREESGCFVVEGKKSVLELIVSSFQIETVACTEQFWRENNIFLKGKKFTVELCSPPELESMSAFKSPDSVLAVARMKPSLSPLELRGLTLALDGVRDPGNFGTILRIADWFGVRTILASEDTTDFYNPKTLQASMGSFCRVIVHDVQLHSYLQSLDLPIYAADKKGKPVHNFAFKKDCILLLGNESRGIRSPLSDCTSETIGIPGYGKAESLNVAAAAAIICDNYYRVCNDPG